MQFQYRHPRLYSVLISLIYPRTLLSRLSAEVGTGHTVFDVAAGYGRMAHVIDRSNSYYGIDRNETFVRYGRKRGVRLDVRDIFSETSYRPSDVVIVVDVVHHFTKAKLRQLFELIFKNAKEKVVIVEPAFVDVAARYGVLGKPIDWFLRTMDYDGFNRIGRWFTRSEYAALFETRFGSQEGRRFAPHVQEVSNHYLVTYTRR